MKIMEDSSTVIVPVSDIPPTNGVGNGANRNNFAVASAAPSEPRPAATGPFVPRSLRLVTAQRANFRIAALLVAVITVVVLCLVFVPWQQTIVGHGQVIIFSAMDRPQNIEAQLSGRLAEWRVEEGQAVKKGETIARLEDIDSKFLAPNQGNLADQQRTALIETRDRAKSRARELVAQQGSQIRARENQLRTGRQRIEQSRRRLFSAQQAQVAAEKSLKIAREVAVQAARERTGQAENAVVQAEQSLKFAQQNLKTARLQRTRIGELYGEGLRSKRDFELADNDLVKNQTDVSRAEQSLTIARAGTNLGILEQSRADVELTRVRTQVEQARAAVQIAERDISTAQFDLAALEDSTQATVSSIGASLESARESVAKAESEIQKQEADRQNLVFRNRQQIVTAPSGGKIVRLLKVGAGTTVKAGDVLAVIMPETADRSVELMVTDNDVPLISEGSRVRLQLAGWPALQWVGWPSVAVGTFAGVVTVIDAVDDGTARYRIIVRPDTAAIRTGKDVAWPSAKLLRPGGEATGWIMLGTVPLGFELWRQFNAFPPTVKRAPVGQKGEKDGYGSGDAKKGDGDRDGEKNDPFLKVKYKK